MTSKLFQYCLYFWFMLSFFLIASLKPRGQICLSRSSLPVMSLWGKIIFSISRSHFILHRKTGEAWDLAKAYDFLAWVHFPSLCSLCWGWSWAFHLTVIPVMAADGSGIKAAPSLSWYIFCYLWLTQHIEESFRYPVISWLGRKTNKGKLITKGIPPSSSSPPLLLLLLLFIVIRTFSMTSTLLTKF